MADPPEGEKRQAAAWTPELRRRMIDAESTAIEAEAERLRLARSRLEDFSGDVVAQGAGTVLGGAILAAGAAALGLIGKLGSDARIALGVAFVTAVASILAWWWRNLRVREELLRRYLHTVETDEAAPVLFDDSPAAAERFLARRGRRRRSQ